MVRWLSGVPRGEATVLARTPTPEAARPHAPIAAAMLGAKLPRGCDLDHCPLAPARTIAMANHSTTARSREPGPSRVRHANQAIAG